MYNYCPGHIRAHKTSEDLSMFAESRRVHCSLPFKKTPQHGGEGGLMLVCAPSAKGYRAKSKRESVLAVLKDLCWNTFANQYSTTRPEIWWKVAQARATIQARWGGDTKSHARLTASSMTSPCDLISSWYIVMTEDLTWQPAQSTPTHSLMKWQDRKREQKRNSLSWRGYWCRNTCDPGGGFFVFFLEKLATTLHQHHQNRKPKPPRFPSRRIRDSLMLPAEIK